MGTTLATEFDIVECELKGLLPNAGYRGLVDIFEDGIGAAGNIKESTIVVYNKAGNKYALYNVSSAEVLGVFDHNDPNGPMGVSQLEEVGAVVKFSLSGGIAEVFVFNGDGLKMQVLKFDQDAFDQINIPEGPLGAYDDEVLLTSNFFAESSNFPFAGSGIDAAVRLPSSVASPSKTLLFSSNGSEFMQTLRRDGKMINFPSQSNSDFPGTPGSLFDKIGAGARIFFGNGTEQLLLINDTGDQMLYWEGDVKTGSNDFQLNDSTVEGSFSGVRLLK